MLREGHLRLVLSSLLGSIFVNLLFILGLATMVGGYKHKDQKYNKETTQVLIYFMNLGVLSLLVPVLSFSHSSIASTRSLMIPPDFTPRVNQASPSGKCCHAPV